MKTLLLAGMFAALAACAANPTIAQLRPSTTDYASMMAYRVTVSRQGERLTTLHVPPGTHLRVIGRHERPLYEVDDSTLVYHGDVTLRLRAASQVDPAEGKVMSDIMSLAPIVMEMKDVDVEVKIIDPASK